jgi:hypothetical protein
MPRPDYFKRRASVIGFLNACDNEPFHRKMEAYITCLQDIDKGIRSKKAQELLDRYRKASILLILLENERVE